MALTLKFSSQDGRQATVGPLQQAYFQGETLSERPGAPPLAQHVEHSWIVGGQRYSRIDCECRVTLTFCSGDGERIESCGPFEHFSTIDGVAFADRNVCATVDRELGDWYSMEFGRHWPALCVQPQQ